MEFKYEEAKRKFTPGNYRFCVIDAKDSVSKAGNEMKVIDCQISGTEIKVKYFFVAGDSLNQRLSRFYDSCPEIKEGDLNCVNWVGAIGAAKFGYDDNGYIKLWHFIPYKEQADLPAYEGKKVERQEVSNLDDGLEEMDSLPF